MKHYAKYGENPSIECENDIFSMENPLKQALKVSELGDLGHQRCSSTFIGEFAKPDLLTGLLW